MDGSFSKGGGRLVVFVRYYNILMLLKSLDRDCMSLGLAEFL